jgi:hypothetical protein
MQFIRESHSIGKLILENPSDALGLKVRQDVKINIGRNPTNSYCRIAELFIRSRSTLEYESWPLCAHGYWKHHNPVRFDDKLFTHLMLLMNCRN